MGTLLALVVIFDVAFLTLPTLVIVLSSLTPGNVVTFPPSGLSLRWYGELLGRTAFLDAFWRSLEVALICTALSLPAGVLGALSLVRYVRRGRTVARVFLLLPFTLPLVASGLALMLLFGELGVLSRLWPLGVALCIVNLPFMIWAVEAASVRLDPDLEDAAKSCGATPLRAFLTVTLPALMPGAITGGLIMFVLSFNEFLVSLLLTDARTVTLPVLVYNAIRSILTPDIAAVSVVYIAVGAVAVLVLDRLVGLELFLRSR